MATKDEGEMSSMHKRAEGKVRKPRWADRNLGFEPWKGGRTNRDGGKGEEIPLAKSWLQWGLGPD